MNGPFHGNNAIVGQFPAIIFLKEPIMDPIRIFTAEEVCRLLGVSAVTLWRERKAGRISFRRIASKIIFTEADILEFLERNRNAAASNRKGASLPRARDDSSSGYGDRGDDR